MSKIELVPRPLEELTMYPWLTHQTVAGQHSRTGSRRLRSDVTGHALHRARVQRSGRRSAQWVREGRVPFVLACSVLTCLSEEDHFQGLKISIFYTTWLLNVANNNFCYSTEEKAIYLNAGGKTHCCGLLAGPCNGNGFGNGFLWDFQD